MAQPAPRLTTDAELTAAVVMLACSGKPPTLRARRSEARSDV